MWSVASIGRILFIYCLCLILTVAEEFARKFEYQFSFKGPQITIDNKIPFWSYGESALPSDDQIRLVPSIRSKKGYIWSQFAFNSENFEIDVVFKITGRGRIGADGMAFWFTDSPGFEGNVYGNRDMWTGLGVFLDSYDNDGKGNNPYISAVVNDGTISYDHAQDGGKQVLAGCQFDFRNKPFPTRLRIRYYQKELTVWFSGGLTQEPQFDICLTHKGIDVPGEKFLGVSAATGGLADDHDILSYLTHSLFPVESLKDHQKVSEDEKERLSEEFKKFSDTMEERKKTFRDKNPEKFKNVDEEIEDIQERQLKMVFDGQQRLNRLLMEIKSKVDGWSSMGGATGGSAKPDEFRKIQYEISSIAKTVNHISFVASEQKSIVAEIQSRVIQLSNKNIGGGGQGGLADSTGLAGDTKSMKLDLSAIKQEVSSIKQSVNRIPTKCPAVPAVQSDSDNSSCVSNSLFIFFSLLQIGIVAIFFYMQRQREQAAKKFF